MRRILKPAAPPSAKAGHGPPESWNACEDLYRSLKENGILVRWFDSPRIRDFVRITVGDLEQMHTLIDQVEQLLDAL